MGCHRLGHVKNGLFCGFLGFKMHRNGRDVERFHFWRFFRVLTETRQFRDKTRVISAIPDQIYAIELDPARGAFPPPSLVQNFFHKGRIVPFFDPIAVRNEMVRFRRLNHHIVRKIYFVQKISKILVDLEHVNASDVDWDHLQSAQICELGLFDFFVKTWQLFSPFAALFEELLSSFYYFFAFLIFGLLFLNLPPNKQIFLRMLF